MSLVIGNVLSLDGKFYAKSEDGSLREISKGDEIYEGKTVVGNDGNEPTDSAVIAVDGAENIIVSGNDAQLFDASISKEVFSQEDTTTENSSINSMVDKIDQIETAAVEDTPRSTDAGEVNFIESNSADTDINAKLSDNEFETKTDERTYRFEENSVAQNKAEVLDKNTPQAEAVVAKAQTQTIQEVETNNEPTLILEPIKTLDEDTTTTITFSATDADGTVITTAVAQHGEVVVNSDDGTITYTPDENYNGTDTITVTVTDDDGAVITKESTITVESVNDLPVITVLDTTANENVSQVIANVSDIDGTIDISTLSAENGTLTISENGDITYTPNENFSGTDSVSVSVTDNSGETVTQTIAMDINANPDAVDDIGFEPADAVLAGEMTFEA
jgi:CshA-type fibril repeat protein